MYNITNSSHFPYKEIIWLLFKSPNESNKYTSVITRR